MTADRIMIVDDETAVGTLMALILEDRGYQARAFQQPAAALKALSWGAWSMVLTDLKMPGIDGFSLLDNIRQSRPELPVVVVSAFITPEMTLSLRQRGAHGVLAKPFEPEELVAIVASHLPTAVPGGHR